MTRNNSTVAADHLRAEATRGLELIDSFYDEVFAILDAWSRDLTAQLTDLSGQWPLSDAHVASLVEARSLEILDEERIPFYGAGFCASDRVVAEGNPLAWWQGPERKPLTSSLFGVGPGAVDLRRLEWYRVPETTGNTVVAGPFVDYLCSNEVTLTASKPLTVHGAFAGVLCLDVLVSEFETEFLPKFTSGSLVTVMNDLRRVVVSTDVTLLTGDRVPAERLEAAGAGVATSDRHPCIVLCEPAA